MLDNKKWWLLIFVICSISIVAKAQTPSYKWKAGLKGTHNINDKSSVEFNLSARETFNKYGSDEVDRYTERVEMKAGYYYKFKGKLKVGLAYMYRSNNPFEDYRSSENRLTQQFSYKSNFLLPIGHRLRVEERIYEKDMAFRLRYQLKYKGSFSGKEVEVNSFYYTISDELLFSYREEWSGENRIGLGLGYLFKNKSAIDFGVSSRYSDILSEKKKTSLILETIYSFKF